jgi:KaiC/GvpD/RAD55 family RecA-like ATPase
MNIPPMPPVTFENNAFFQMAPLGDFVPRIILSSTARPVHLYQWPTSSVEVDLWSAIHFYSLVNARRLAHNILPWAVRRDDFLRDRHFIVALKRRYVPEAGWTLGRGAWACPSEGVCGENVVELYAFVHWCSYRDAILALAHEAKLVGPSSEVRRQNKGRDWSPVPQPLHREVEVPDRLAFYPWDSEWQIYKNLSGHPILKAGRWRQHDGQIVRLYRSLWCYRSSQEFRWAEILPQAPYPLFNAHLVAAQPSLPVVLVQDEFEATEQGRKYSNCVFSTVPGGLKNLSKADLNLLKGCSVLVVLNLHDLEEGHRIHHALQTAGVIEAQFSLGHREARKSFAELESTASQKGVSLFPSPNGGILALPSQIVVEAGQPIPGGDEVRRSLFDPGIREGDLVWLFAEPKIGKTWFGLDIAYTAARGNCAVGRLRATEASGVLYVDGEMQPDDLQRSIAMVMAGAGDQPGPAPFAIICAKGQPDGVVDITSEEWQATIEKTLRGKKLLILDNFQSLTDNGPAALNQVRPWLRKLTQMGIAVIVLDHTNREGDLQGSIAKERIADLLIALRYPDDQAKKEGRILVEYPRARRLHGADEEPYQLQKIFTETTFKLEVVEPEASGHIDVRPQIFRIALVVFARDQEHFSYPEIYKKYGIAQSTAHGYYQEAPTLIGDEKAAFDKELQRLIAERVPTTSS